MNQKQLKAIVQFKVSSHNPQIINSQLKWLNEYEACDYYIRGDCQLCNACEIKDILDNPEDYL